MVMGIKTKRKTSTLAQPARKKAKTERLSANDLPWKVIHRTDEAGVDTGMEGIMELEEVEGVEVVYEETEAGRVAKFHVILLFMATKPS
jgi:ATP-dependent RNA helicase DDX24/MAK5